MKLTTCQQEAFNRFVEFMEDDETPALTIKGAAGVGKTSLTKYIADYLMDTKKVRVAAVAPTHKARRVLDRMLNEERWIRIPSMTIASILGKMREHSYIGSHRYSNGSKQKMDQYACFIIDEVSMVCDRDLEQIEDYVCLHDKKLILIGDDCQIPAPSQPLIESGDVCSKADSSAFSIVSLCELREVVRQVADSVILRMAMFMRDNLVKDLDLLDMLTALGIEKDDVCIGFDESYVMFVESWANQESVRMIAYTNASVRAHNSHIRAAMRYENLIVVGELLTGYNNLGFPVHVIENGTDYRVVRVSAVSSHRVGIYGGLHGLSVDLEDIDDGSNTSNNLFFITIGHRANLNFLNELVNRAEKVNSSNSTKADYKNYCSLKNSTVFLEDVYKHENSIMTETDMKERHPLLFVRTHEVLDTSSRRVLHSKLTEKIEEQYPGILERRRHDNKSFADGEVLADQYMVVEKDIYYGYAITSHKSQGSTYDRAFVDENDFLKIKNKWNYRFGCTEMRTKERNQLRYVAYTRASKFLHIMQ